MFLTLTKDSFFDFFFIVAVLFMEDFLHSKYFIVSRTRLQIRG